MTAMTSTPDASATPSPSAAPFRRRLELIVAAVGFAAAAVLQGGFAFVISRADDQALQESVLPALRAAGLEVADADAHVALNTLAGWFGFSLILIALLCAIGWFFAAYRPRRRSTGWWFFGAGLACLFGTQLVLYPVAFLFFLSAALFAVRTPIPGSSK
ncbi:hypothetical protein [Microbacterium sp. CIAB417]|uniref:hypothetical protein n=1 Tax=Microbacterium sp. CIAB417 TaxID=2860287 RepID=UPI001FACE25B|nr:hypothetical protein [Microbacterium sp. CIAB417]